MAVHPSHEEEQTRVREFFGGDNSGYFVEVGANHPTHGSQTWHLEQAGWTGVLVEPQPDLAAFLVSDYSGYINGEQIVMDGGEQLQGASELHHLGDLLTEEQWQAMKPKKK